jgi:hypothetical protein
MDNRKQLDSLRLDPIRDNKWSSWDGQFPNSVHPTGAADLWMPAKSLKSPFNAFDHPDGRRGPLFGDEAISATQVR